MTPKVRTAWFLLVVATALTACSGSGPPMAESPQAFEAFVRDADRACATADGRLVQLSAPTWQAPLERRAAYLRATVPVFRRLVTNLRALTPPDGDREELERMWEQLDVVIDRFSQAIRAAKAGDESGYQMAEIGGFERLMDVRWLLTRYGLRACELGMRADGTEA